MVCNTGCCHDRGWVRIDENYLIALFLERFYRLGSAVVEFAGLTDNNRSTSDNQDSLYVFSCAHSVFTPSFATSMKRSKIQEPSWGPGEASG